MAKVSPSNQLTAARHLLGPARAALQAHPNVLGVGVGLRQRSGKHTEEICFVVSVAKKEDVASRDLLPRRLFGIPVDVQEHRSASLTGVALAGDRVQRPGLTEYGHVGTIGSDGTSRWAITVMHVLAGITGPVNYPYDQDGYFPTTHGLPPNTAFLGAFAEGTFSGAADIARIRIDASVQPTPGPKPVSLYEIALNIPVSVTVGQQVAKGTLTQFPAPPVTVTLGGNDFVIHDAAAFGFDDGSIVPGWLFRPYVSAAS